MSLVLPVCGPAALASALPAAVFLPGAAAARNEPREASEMVTSQADAGQ
ncbi:hypothetical protein ACFYZE_11880 [Streptomyces sp. NPDC001796]